MRAPARLNVEPESNSPLAMLVDDRPYIDAEIGDEAVDMVRTLAPVEAVPLQHEPLARDVLAT